MLNNGKRVVEGFSFGGCAWHLAFHLGVAESIQNHCDSNKFHYYGSSSGALAALVLTANVPAELAMNKLYKSASKVRGRVLGPIGKMSGLVDQALQDLLPDLKHVDTSRLKISVTELWGLKNHLLPRGELNSRQELINIVLASCYIPLYYEKPTFISNRPFIDGGASDNMPLSKDPHTVTVSPFKREKDAVVDIHPDISPSFYRGLFPNEKQMTELFASGKKKGKEFLQKFTTANQPSEHHDPTSNNAFYQKIL